MNIHDEVAAAVYELFEARGRIPVRELDDWLDAERIVLIRNAGQDMEEPEQEEGHEETAEAKKKKSPKSLMPRKTKKPLETDPTGSRTFVWPWPNMFLFE
jgi:hypothetical protein